MFTEKQWIFRYTSNRLVTVKAKSADVRKVAVLDVRINLMFAVEVPQEINVDRLKIDKDYMLGLKVFTSRDVEGVEGEFVAFFKAGDIDQDIEDFIRAYWVYPAKIRFELFEVEET